MQQKHLLHALTKASPELRKAILKHSNYSLIKAILEIVINALNGNLQMKKECKTRLKKYKSVLRALACSKQKLPHKKQLIVQRGGFLPVLISSLLSSVIGQLLK
jgi:hypothetical protein